MSEVAAIVLAAGRGTRFGEEPKLLAALDGRPMVRHVVEVALASRASPVYVVVGHRRQEVEAALSDRPVCFIGNSRYVDGLATSLRAGLALLPAEAQAAVILLGDMPRISARTVDRLIEAWHKHGRPAAAIPTVSGQRGNPVLLSRVLESAISHLQGDSGAGPLLRGRSDVVEVPVDDPAILQDVDTRDALERLRDASGGG